MMSYTKLCDLADATDWRIGITITDTTPRRLKDLIASNPKNTLVVDIGNNLDKAATKLINAIAKKPTKP